MHVCGVEFFEGTKGYYVPKRCIFTILGFFGTIIIYATRVNLSIAIVAMVNTASNFSLNETHPVTGCNNPFQNVSHIVEDGFKGEKYDWDSKTQGLILSSFFYGYIVTQIPAGILCERYGAKWFFGGGVLVTTSLYLLIPLAASWGVAAIVIVRILEGLGEGLTFPAITCGISNWAPKSERSRISSIIFAGMPIGNIIAMPLSGFLSSNELLGGWPSTFYLFGTIGCIWVFFWSILAYETPEQHPNISKEELKYIQQTRREKTKEKTTIPWKDIFTSMPMWAVIIAHFGHNYAFLMFLTVMPTYFASILHFDIQLNGYVSALPYAVQAISAMLTSFIADKLRESNKLSVTAIRKVFNTIGLIGPALCFLGITASGCRPVLIVVFLCLVLFLNGFIFSGYNVTHVDMSPDFAGVIYGITNAIANTAGILSPMVVGFLTADGATVESWNSVFCITSTICMVCAVFFACFASAEIQPWGCARRETCTVNKPGNIYFIESTVN